MFFPVSRLSSSRPFSRSASVTFISSLRAMAAIKRPARTFFSASARISPFIESSSCWPMR